MSLGDCGQADLLETVGLSDDGWSEPVLSCRFRARENLATCQLGIWMKPEMRRARSRVGVRINGTDAFGCDVPHDMPAVVEVACRMLKGETISLDVICDNLVTEKGADVRQLSFKITSLHFS